MNDLRTAAQQALEALIKGCNINATEWHQAIYALRAALAQQAEPAQEPYAWHYTNNAGASVWHRGPSNRLDADMQAARYYPHAHKVTPLYTAPPQRKLVPLTEEEIFKIENDIPDDVISDRAWTICLTRAVEKAVWEKNHGQA